MAACFGLLLQMSSIMQGLLSFSGRAMKVLLALFLLVSALAKFVGIDSFELYLYTLQLLPLVACQVLARVVIAGELWLAIMLLSGRQHRLTISCLLLALLLFTVVLGVLALRGHSDNCHCMGELMAFSPVESILKNAVLLFCALFAGRYGDSSAKPHWWAILLFVVLTVELLIQCGYWGQIYLNGYQRNFLYVWMAVLMVASIFGALPSMQRGWIAGLLAAVPLATVFILSPPDGWRLEKEQLHYDRAMLSRQLNEGGALYDSSLAHGRKVVAFYSTSCHYCQTAAQKLGVLQEQMNLPDTLFVNVFPQGREGSVAAFHAAGRSPYYTELQLPADTFLHLTYGQFPLVMLLDEGEVTVCRDFRDIDEKELAAFLDAINK